MAQTVEKTPNPCHWCASGDHHICTGINCYRCPHPHRKVRGVGTWVAPTDEGGES